MVFFLLDDSGSDDESVVEIRFEQAAELARKIHRDARVDGALAVEETLRGAKRENTLVPDIRVDIQAARTVEAKTDEIIRRNIVARRRQRDHKRDVIQGKEELAAVGMVVGVPEQHP